MTERLTKKAEDIFYTAAKIESAGERANFLKLQCDGNPELRAFVDRLLAIQPQAEKYFEVDAAKVLRPPQQ